MTRALTRWHLLWATLALAATLVSCSSAPPPASVTGTWVGVWGSAETSKGTVTVTVTDNAGVVTGTVNVSTLGSGLVDGTYSKATGRWSGTLDVTIAAASFDLTVNGTTASGMYTMSGGVSGNAELHRPR